MGYEKIRFTVPLFFWKLSKPEFQVKWRDCYIHFAVGIQIWHQWHRCSFWHSLTKDNHPYISWLTEIYEKLSGSIRRVSLIVSTANSSTAPENEVFCWSLWGMLLIFYQIWVINKIIMVLISLLAIWWVLHTSKEEGLTENPRKNWGVNNSFEGHTGFGIIIGFLWDFWVFSGLFGVFRDFWDFLEFFLRHVRDFSD